MTQLVKHLPWKHEGLSSVPRTHRMKKPGMRLHARNPSNESQGGECVETSGSLGLAGQPP